MMNRMSIVLFVLTVASLFGFYLVTEYQGRAVEKKCFDNVTKICGECCDIKRNKE